MKRTKLCQVGLFVLLLLSLFGCGGGGGSLSNAFNLFITDDASTQYSGVWVKLYKAQLQAALKTIRKDPRLRHSPPTVAFPSASTTPCNIWLTEGIWKGRAGQWWQSPQFSSQSLNQSISLSVLQSDIQSLSQGNGHDKTRMDKIGTYETG